MVGDFPVVRLLFPPDARTQRTDSDDVTLSVANSTKSLADDGTSMCMFTSPDSFPVRTCMHERIYMYMQVHA